jgi:hypothetical protein
MGGGTPAAPAGGMGISSQANAAGAGAGTGAFGGFARGRLAKIRSGRDKPPVESRGVLQTALARCRGLGRVENPPPKAPFAARAHAAARVAGSDLALYRALARHVRPVDAVLLSGGCPLTWGVALKGEAAPEPPGSLGQGQGSPLSLLTRTGHGGRVEVGLLLCGANFVLLELNSEGDYDVTINHTAGEV